MAYTEQEFSTKDQHVLKSIFRAGLWKNVFNFLKRAFCLWERFMPQKVDILKHFSTVSLGMKRRSRSKAAIALLLLVLLVGGSLVFSITVAEVMFVLIIVIVVIMILVSTIQSKLGGKRR